MTLSKLRAEIETHFSPASVTFQVLKSGWAGQIVSVQPAGSSMKYIAKAYGPGPSATANLKKEWSALQALHAAGYPVPKPVSFQETAAAAHILMEQIEGRNLWDALQGSSDSQRDRLIRQFVRLLVQLHSLNPALAAPDQGAPGGQDFVANELQGIEDDLRRYNLPVLLPLAGWARTAGKQIAPQKLSLLHRDYHPWNVIVNENNDLFVVDWVWGVGDFRFDLAWTCCLMERSGFEPFAASVRALYEELIQTRIPDFDFFVVLSTLRWLTNVLISSRSGENLNEARQAEFSSFIAPLVANALNKLNEVTAIEVGL